MKILPTVCIAAFFAFSGFVRAETRTVKLRTLCFEHINEIKKVLLVTTGEKPKATEVSLFTTVFSDEVEIPVVDDVMVFSVLDGMVDGKPKYKTVASAKVVPGPRQLAIFVPAPPNGLPYQVFVVDDSEKNFPMGSTMAINLSTIGFKFLIGENTAVVPPGKITVVPMAKKINDRGQCSVIISVAVTADEWRAVNQTRWFTGTNKRDVAVGFVHPQTKQPTVNCYADTPPWTYATPSNPVAR